MTAPAEGGVPDNLEALLSEVEMVEAIIHADIVNKMRRDIAVGWVLDAAVALAASREEVRTAARCSLRRYGKHDWSCGQPCGTRGGIPTDPCSCGLEAALRSPESPPAEATDG